MQFNQRAFNPYVERSKTCRPIFRVHTQEIERERERERMTEKSGQSQVGILRFFFTLSRFFLLIAYINRRLLKYVCYYGMYVCTVYPV